MVLQTQAITGDNGTTNVNGNVTNNGNISQKSITVADTATFTTNANNVTATDGIDNAGTLNLGEGTLATLIKNNAGITNITANVTNNASIAQRAVNIQTGASLTTDASNISATDGINNTNILLLQVQLQATVLQTLTTIQPSMQM